MGEGSGTVQEPGVVGWSVSMCGFCFLSASRAVAFGSLADGPWQPCKDRQMHTSTLRGRASVAHVKLNNFRGEFTSHPTDPCRLSISIHCSSQWRAAPAPARAPRRDSQNEADCCQKGPLESLEERRRTTDGSCKKARSILGGFSSVRQMAKYNTERKPRE